MTMIPQPTVAEIMGIAVEPTESIEPALKPKMAAIIRDGAFGMVVERGVVKQARHRPRLVEVCESGRCEKRWGVTG